MEEIEEVKPEENKEEVINVMIADEEPTTETEEETPAPEVNTEEHSA